MATLPSRRTQENFAVTGSCMPPGSWSAVAALLKSPPGPGPRPSPPPWPAITALPRAPTQRAIPAIPRSNSGPVATPATGPPAGPPSYPEPQKSRTAQRLSRDPGPVLRCMNEIRAKSVRTSATRRWTDRAPPACPPHASGHGSRTRSRGRWPDPALRCRRIGAACSYSPQMSPSGARRPAVGLDRSSQPRPRTLPAP